MNQQGRLTEWNDERGFGFITPLDGGQRVFVHVSEFPHQQRRPYLNDLVVFSGTQDERGRPRAAGVKFLAPTHSKALRARTRSPSALLIPAVVLVLLAALVALGLMPSVLLGVYAGASVIAFVMYWADKAAAEGGGWRTSEASLHLASLLGGWPGAFAAQRMFRHKTIKQPFQTIFWLTVGANVLLVVLICAGILASPG